MAHISFFFCNLSLLIRQKQTAYKCISDPLVSSENSTGFMTETQWHQINKNKTKNKTRLNTSK